MSEEKTPVVKMCNKKLLTTLQQKLSATITSNSDSKIAKILSIKSCPKITNVDVYQGGVKAALEVSYRAVVCLETGEIVCSEETLATANVVYENSKLTQNAEVKMLPCIVDNETTILQGEVTVNTLVSTDIFMKDNACNFFPPEYDDCINVKTLENQVCSLKDKINATGIIKGEIVVENKFKRIVFSSYTGFLKNYEIKTDYFIIKGEMFANFLCEYEDGQLKSFTKQFDFSEEIEQKGIDSQDILQLEFNTSFIPTTNVVVNQNNETVIEVEMPYTLTGDIYTCFNQEVVVDAYNIDRQVKLTTESFEHCINKESCFAEEKIIAGFNLSEDSPRIERILGTVGENISLVNVVTKNGEIILEGIANVGAIYYSEDEDGNKVLNSVVIDLPYSLNIINKDIKENDIVSVDLKLGEISVKNKKGRELEIIANVYICYNLSTPTISAFTTKIDLGEEKQQCPYALEIVVVKEGEELWDIAKRLSIKEEMLIAQNPEIALPLVGGEKLVVFRARENK